MRRWLWLDSVLVFVTGIQCFILSDYTARFFAWTINPPLTAAFLGACYWAAFPFVFLSARERVWARARIALFGVFIFTAITLAATLLHLDRFHLASPEPLAFLAAWAWMLVYVLVPPSLLILIALQLRAPGGDPDPGPPLPTALRLVLSAQTVALVPLGIALFAVPTAAAPAWPWALTPLTARAVGAWLIGMGITFGHAAWENDWQRVRSVMVGYALLGGLQLLAVARYATAIDWSRPSAPLYVVFLASILAVGAYGWRVSWREDASTELRSVPALA
jgi:hypothetical protein